MCSSYGSLAAYGLQTASAANRGGTDAPHIGGGLGRWEADGGDPTLLVAIQDGGCWQHPTMLPRAPHQPSPRCKDGSTPRSAAALGWKHRPPRLDPADPRPHSSLQR